jgi:Flp pilus assembly protein TadD
VAEQKVYDEAQLLLAAGNFTAAEARIQEAADAGTQSPRLTNLLAQSVRQIPAVLALVDGGRLTEFGFDIGGIQSRDTPGAERRAQLNAALAILAPAGDSDRDILLNRGHVLLSLNRDRESEAEFAKATALDADDPLAWLGLGLAKFVQEDYDGASAAFEKSRQLDPRSIAARFNLALTLEEQGRNVAARAVWQELAAEPLTPADRNKVNEAIRLLQQPPGN